MQETWIELGGVLIRSPVTAGTNLVLAVQCLLYYRTLRSSVDPRPRLWSGFFLMMSLASAAAILKHGFKHDLSETAYFWVLWASSLTGGISTYYAQRATIASYASPGLAKTLDGVVLAQLVVFLAVNVVMGPVMLLLVANTAVGMVPIIVVEARSFRKGERAAGWIAAGLTVSILTAVVYLFTISAGAWLNHIDIAHILMGVSFFLMVRGAGPLERPSAPVAATGPAGGVA